MIFLSQNGGILRTLSVTLGLEDFLAFVGIFYQRDGRQQQANDENGINKKTLKFKLTQFDEQTPI
ncbi:MULTISPECIES: hypothetical protein [unclassified Arcicella]|uniref:hypothetical protein n=1 Tax=unclassified Arcicella TaxID=2644986 RepID=UPI002861C276|nr:MULTISPECIES: hypothetical protein [unclassified Arcicella]MDR6563194.1 DNA-binding protein Fis [Arcicella sp. BE51]MDR6811655.1 DNA-binding protein Fis [Arcicella sp. BE140]MDR6823180.1 DNA-binding protein Fis [Arcicella sp. BE139]